MKFGDCFRMLCYTHGSNELSLVSGEGKGLRSTKLRKIKDRINLNAIFDNFFDQVSHIGHSSCKVKHPRENIINLLGLDDPHEKIKELVLSLDCEFYDVEKVLAVVRPFLDYGEVLQKVDIMKIIREVEEFSEKHKHFIGFFLFFNLSDYSIEVCSSSAVASENRKICCNEKNFCIANLFTSQYGQDMNIAEGFCSSFNTMLKRNNFRQFHVNIFG